MAVHDYYRRVRRMRHRGAMITATSRMMTVPETAHDGQPNGQGCYNCWTGSPYVELREGCEAIAEKRCFFGWSGMNGAKMACLKQTRQPEAALMRFILTVTALSEQVSVRQLR